jgi:hypothetical protein
VLDIGELSITYPDTLSYYSHVLIIFFRGRNLPY